MNKSRGGDRRFAVGVVATLCFLQAGCETLSEVRGSDYHAFLPSLRVAWELKGSPSGDSVAQPHSGRAIEMFVASGSGDATQGFAAGQLPIQFGGMTINPPQTIRERFELSAVGVTHRWRKIFRTVGFEYFVGLGYGGFDATLDTGTQLAHEKRDGGYVPAGAGFIWNVAPRTSLQARAMFGGSSHFSFNRNEIAVAQGLTKSMALRVGWFNWRWDDNRDAVSDVRLKLAGPTLGLDWEF